MTLRVLLDPSVRRNAVTHKTVLQKETVQWGETTQSLEMAKRCAFPPRPDEKFRKEQIPYIAALLGMVADGMIALFKTPEIRMEDMRNKIPDRGYLGLDLLDGVSLSMASSPMERLIVYSGFGDSIGTTKEEQITFFKTVKEDRYVELRNLVGNAHLGDIFHFWTAEVNQIDVYLTMDKRFIRVFRKSVKPKIDSQTDTLTPKELCARLDVPPGDLEKIEKDNPPFS